MKKLNEFIKTLTGSKIGPLIMNLRIVITLLIFSENSSIVSSEFVMVWIKERVCPTYAKGVKIIFLNVNINVTVIPIGK